NFRGLRWWRVLLAGFFLALALYHVRAVPFFAAVAAPVLALNVQEVVARWREANPPRRRDPLLSLARAFGFLLLRVLLATGYVGPAGAGGRPHRPVHAGPREHSVHHARPVHGPGPGGQPRQGLGATPPGRDSGGLRPGGNSPRVRRPEARRRPAGLRPAGAGAG